MEKEPVALLLPRQPGHAGLGSADTLSYWDGRTDLQEYQWHESRSKIHFNWLIIVSAIVSQAYHLTVGALKWHYSLLTTHFPFCCLNRKITSYSGKMMNAGVNKWARKRTAKIAFLIPHSTLFTGMSSPPVTATGKHPKKMESINCWYAFHRHQIPSSISILLLTGKDGKAQVHSQSVKSLSV